MKEKGYEDMWILPEMYIFDRNPVPKHYINHPPGNSPELCNINSCLNEDLHNAVDCYVRFTHSLHKLYPKKFSIATSKKVTSAYLWIFDPIDGIAPSINWIILYKYDVLTSTYYIVEAEVYIIPYAKNAKNTRRGR